MHRVRHFVCVVAWLAFSALASASPYRGVVTFGGLPLPGATDYGHAGNEDDDGRFRFRRRVSFDDLADGKWTIDVQMQLFAADSCRGDDCAEYAGGDV